MKGLLLKDFYLLMKYCRVFLLAIIVFTGVACLQEDSTFFILYPAIMAGMIPITIYSYDEREKWDIYSMTLPYTREQLVSAKYLTGLMVNLIVTGIVAVTQALFHSYTNTFIMQDYFLLLAVMLVLGLLGPSILLPFVFKFGAEKGRIAYYIIMFSCFALSVLVMDSGVKPFLLGSGVGLGIMVAVIIGIYFISWFISVLFYRKREL